MMTRLAAWRIRRRKIRAWKRYYAAVENEHYFESYGLGHPEWIVQPAFPDPRELS